MALQDGLCHDKQYAHSRQGEDGGPHLLQIDRIARDGIMKARLDAVSKHHPYDDE